MAEERKNGEKDGGKDKNKQITRTKSKGKNVNDLDMGRQPALEAGGRNNPPDESNPQPQDGNPPPIDGGTPGENNPSIDMSGSDLTDGNNYYGDGSYNSSNDNYDGYGDGDGDNYIDFNDGEGYNTELPDTAYTLDAPETPETPEEPEEPEMPSEEDTPRRKISRISSFRTSAAGRALSFVAPKAARLALKATLAGAGAMAGMASGLVSDDYSNVAKWGATGAGVGVVAGGGMSRSIEGIQDKATALGDKIYEETHTKDEVKARNNARADKQFLEDPHKIKLYQDKLHVSRREAMEIMQNDVMKYREYGITDDDVIINAMKAEEKSATTASVFGKSKSSNERIMLASLMSKVGDDQRKIGPAKERLKSKGFKQDEINEYINAITDNNTNLI